VIYRDEQVAGNGTREGHDARRGREHRRSEGGRDVDPAMPRTEGRGRWIEASDDRAHDRPCPVAGWTGADGRGDRGEQ
jgi:hypothetical protein